MHLSRRMVLTSSVALALTRPSFSATPKRGGFDLTAPREQLLAYAKMRARLDDGIAIWHHSIDMFALIEGRVSEFLFKREGIGAPVVVDGRISISDDMLVYRTAEGQQRIFSRAASSGDYTATELGAYESDIADVMNANLASAPASRAMVGVVPWAPDFGMGDLKGTLMIRHRAQGFQPRCAARVATRQSREGHAGHFDGAEVGGVVFRPALGNL